MKPFIDKSTNTSKEAEFSIVGLSEHEIEMILSALDWNTMAITSKAKYKVVELAETLNNSYNSLNA